MAIIVAHLTTIEETVCGVSSLTIALWQISGQPSDESTQLLQIHLKD